jgi:hypothetical protein
MITYSLELEIVLGFICRGCPLLTFFWYWIWDDYHLWCSLFYRNIMNDLVITVTNNNNVHFHVGKICYLLVWELVFDVLYDIRILFVIKDRYHFKWGLCLYFKSHLSSHNFIKLNRIFMCIKRTSLKKNWKLLYLKCEISFLCAYLCHSENQPWS